MTDSESKDDAPQQNETSKLGDYTVGKWRPPVHSRWQPGQSGNPKGRRKDRPDMRTEAEGIASKKITVHDGDRHQQLTLYGANMLTHGIKGAKGDVRSSRLFIESVRQMGILGEEDDVIRGDQQAGVPLMAPANKPRLSDSLFEKLNLSLLCREDQIDLSRFAEVVDLGGDITAPSVADFAQVKHIMDKGRGKDITSQISPLAKQS